MADNSSTIIEAGRECLRREAAAVMQITDRLDSSFVKAVTMIYECKGKLIVTGVGKSGHIASKIAATLASTGTPSFYLNPLDAYHGDLGMIAEGDIVMAISYSGNTDELLRFIPLLQMRNIPIIGMSGNSHSLLAHHSTVHLDISVTREADRLNLVPTSSTTVTLAMGDAIACALMEVRNFRESDFAMFHPGGNLGKRLLARVGDYMVTQNMPIVAPDTMLCNAIFEISKNKQGIAVVLENGEIVGAVTDGDIRRAMQRNQANFFSLQVKDVMTHTPKLIKEDLKLSEAEAIMRTNSIHSLIVVDDQRKFRGIIDYFSCVQ